MTESPFQIIQKHIFLYLLLNMSCRNSSQYNGTCFLDSMGFPGFFQGFPVTINRYKGISQFGHYIVARGSERVKIKTTKNYSVHKSPYYRGVQLWEQLTVDTQKLTSKSDY